MNYFQKFLIFIIALSSLSGCAPRVFKPGLTAQEQAVAETISVIRDRIRQSDCQTAERMSQRLFSSYQSADDELERAILTDLCLCHIQQGETSRFLIRAKELESICSEEWLDRETQFVLEMFSYIENGTGYTGTGIDRSIRQGFQQIFEQKGDSHD